MATLSSSVLLLSGLTLTALPVHAQTTPPGPVIEQGAPTKHQLQAPKAVITRTDNFGRTPRVGDVLTFRIRISNPNDQVATVFPKASNLVGAAYLDDGLESCRWINMPAKDAYNCDSAFHVVNEDDLKRGTFTPTITLAFTKDKEGRELLSEQATYAADPIQTTAASNLKPLEVRLQRTDRVGDRAPIGSRLTYNVTVTNPNDVAVDSIPLESNLDGFTYTGVGDSCRHLGLGAKQSYTCNLPFHVVTPEDGKAGNFTPTVKIAIGADKDGFGTLVTTSSGASAVPVFVQPNSDAAAKAVPFEVEWIRTDNLGDTVHLGEVLHWQVRIKNKLGIPVTAHPSFANTLGTVTDESQNCRYINLGNNQEYVCTTVSHVITAKDVKNGSFTPFIVLDALDPSNSGRLVSQGPSVRGKTVQVLAGERGPDNGPRPIGKPTELAKAGDHQFACHRIPALTTAPNGDLLAAWDGRDASCGDAPNPNSIIQRISKDGGQTWSAPKTIAMGHTTSPIHGYSDPSYVVDREKNKIFMFFVKSYDRSFFNSSHGVGEQDRNVLHAAVMESSDNGVTWTQPKVITQSITTHPTHWRSRFAASGEGIQLTKGNRKGRLVQSFTVITDVSQQSRENFQAVTVYSDDHGESWKAGTPFGTYMDENKVVELANGDLLVNSRSSNPNETFRKQAISKDGGVTFGEVKAVPELIDPRNNASIIRAYPNAPVGSEASKVLLFSNSKDTKDRRNGTISISYDEGKTWTKSRVFAPLDTAYSTLTHLRDKQGAIKPGEYGLLYEGSRSTINYVTLDADWLGIKDVSMEPKANERPDHKDPETKPDSTPNPGVPTPPTPPNKPDAPQGPNGPGQPNPPARPAPPQSTPPGGTVPAPAPVPPAPAPQAPAPQVPAPAPAPRPAPSTAPSTAPQGPRTVARVSGETRFETAINLSRATFRDGQASTVILARADVAADSVSAVPLAKALNAPVLLTPRTQLHPGVLAELKRVMAPGAKVLLMGGDAALSSQVEASVAQLGAKVERVAGPNRAATAVATAERLQALGKVKEVLLVDGNDWQADLIAGPAAAKAEGVTLLTNGAQIAPETASFLGRHPRITVTGIGANGAAQVQATTKLTGSNTSDVSLVVAKHYFTRPTALGVATTADFADALAGGAHIAHHEGPLVLVGSTTPREILDWMKGQPVRTVSIYGGPTRISDTQMAAFTE